MPEHALYYPEWVVDDPVFLAESLLYWDHLSCMVPSPDFKPAPWHADDEIRKVIEQIHERFVFRFVPTDEQKQRAHERIRAFAEHDPPEWCRPENLTPHHKQIFSAYKFAPETVELLRERGWTRQVEHPNNLQLQLIADAAADLLLGALADACSSPTMPPVTDDPGSFAANCNLLLQELGSSTGITTQGNDIQQPRITAESDFAFLLAKIPRLGLEPQSVNAEALRRILQARDDPDLDHQRQSFQKKVDEYLMRLRTVEEPERRLIGEEFAREFNLEMKRLDRGLRRIGLEALVSTEGLVGIIVGLLTGALAPGLGLAIGLGGGLLGYHHKRQEAFDQYWSSWIFSVTGPRLSFW